MKTAAEFAEEIIKDHVRRNGATSGSMALEIKIAQALTAFGQQEYQRGHDDGFNEGVCK